MIPVWLCLAKLGLLCQQLYSDNVLCFCMPEWASTTWGVIPCQVVPMVPRNLQPLSRDSVYVSAEGQ